MAIFVQQVEFTSTVLFINAALVIAAVAALYFPETEGKESAYRRLSGHFVSFLDGPPALVLVCCGCRREVGEDL